VNAVTATSLIDRMFSEPVLDRWQGAIPRSKHLEYRMLMLDRRLPPPPGWSTEEFDEMRTRYRHQLGTFLTAASRYGLMDGSGSGDLAAKLTGRNDVNFRSARAECIAAWYLGDQLGLDIGPRPIGRTGPLEFVLRDTRGEIHVEVKAPCREPVLYDLDAVKTGAIRAHTVNDADIVSESVRKARKQFGKTTPNLVFLAAELTIPERWLRRTITEALYGVERWVAERNAETLDIGPFERICDPTGIFLRHLNEGGRPTSTRVSGVLYLEESHDVGAGPLDCNVFLAHNPFASHVLPEDIWRNVPQLKLDGTSLVWSDGFGEHAP